MGKKILLLGSGYMASEYLKVLDSLGHAVTIIGRGMKNIEDLTKKYPSHIYHHGGIENFLKHNTLQFDYAINTVGIDQLKKTTLLLIDSNIKRILVEKPGDLTIAGLKEIQAKSANKSAHIFVAYNRRFYSSVNEIKKQVLADGGITGCHFEFTEWIHTIDPKSYAPETLNKWILANSSHVIDAVFHLIGAPKSINCNVGGFDLIPWHTSGSTFVGSGISKKNIPFTYHSNWNAPGRWSVEILTPKRRFFLRPMEKLLFQKIGSVSIEEIQLTETKDLEYKPGLFLQTQAFLGNDQGTLVQLEEHITNMTYYFKISGYNDTVEST